MDGKTFDVTTWYAAKLDEGWTVVVRFGPAVDWRTGVVSDQEHAARWMSRREG